MLRSLTLRRKHLTGARGHSGGISCSAQHKHVVCVGVYFRREHSVSAKSSMTINPSLGWRAGGLALLTLAALLVHGYHPYAEDAEIYLPGILKIINPSLFPSNPEFFAHHAGYSLYPALIASSVRLSHLPLPWVALLWQVASIFLVLAGTWRLAAAFFEQERARWGAVVLMAGLLTLPVAGTALYIVDQYLNPRNLAAFAAIFAVAELLHRRHGATVLWLLFAAAVHPLMASFGILFCAWMVILERYRPGTAGLAVLVPGGIFDLPTPAYHEVALRQPYFFVLRWEWYEWLGVIGPVVLFWWFARLARRQAMRNVERVSRAMIPYIALATLASIVLSIPGRLEPLARFEPLRCLALAYMILITIGGGLLAQHVLRGDAWRWLVLFVPLSVGMYAAQRQLFPASQHIEWPWSEPRNPWAQAFLWIRSNTPTESLFALNPRHMELPGEDENGFRARAERSMLADAVKDKGAASAFPPLAEQWLEQYEAQRDWEHFQKDDFERLRQRYGISWIVVQQPGPAGLECPYENSVVRVCRLR